MLFDLLEKILTSPAGSFGFVAGLLGLAFWLVHWVTKKITKITSSHENIEKSSNKIDGYIDTMRNDIVYIKGVLQLLQNQNNDFAQAHSPINLSQKGKELAKTIHVEAMVDRNWQNAKKQIDAEVVNKNAYDIQQYCIETMAVEPTKFLCEDDVMMLKQHAYSIGRTFQAVSIVPALTIRNRYFEEKNINVADVDKFDPNQPQN